LLTSENLIVAIHILGMNKSEYGLP